MLNLQKRTVTFNEGTPDEKQALRPLHLSLKKGDFVTIIGGNGAGKSTLMNVISGVQEVDTGKIIIDNRDVTYLPEYKRSEVIGRVFQDPMAGTAPTMTIEENLALAYSRNKRRKLIPGVSTSRKDIFRTYLKPLNLGLENRLNAKVGLLSGGERQALSLLMATFTEPKILLLDEHTAALDPDRAQLITNLTKKIVDESNLTTIMVTHNMQQALDLGNRLIMMDKGEVILHAEEEEKRELTIEKLLKEFKKRRGASLSQDQIILA